MAGACGSVGLFASLWICLGEFLLLSSSVWTFNLHASAPVVYSGPNESYFGFALDFYRDSKGSMNVVVGAPLDNTSQPGVIEGGSVYLCPWASSGSSCTPIEFDAKGDQTEQYHTITVKTFKSKQWFGASVNTWKDNIMACAPLQHWNAFENYNEATKTPVGSCLVATGGLKHIVEYSPCRQVQMHSFYSSRHYINDNRYCEAGFSLAISDSGRLLLGAPGGYYFGGLIASVDLSAIQMNFLPTHNLLPAVNQVKVTRDHTDWTYNDAYRGYSVAFGEFNEDSQSPEYVVGLPNKSLTQGVVEILSLKQEYKVLWTLSSEQVASYFGHTVAVADVNGDGKDDILVGAPLFMERRSDRKLYEVGRVYLYLQRKVPHPYSTPWQILTGTDVYGRFGMTIAPLGDVDQDGYTDIAIGAPFAGQDEGGRVYIYRGHQDGLSASPSQILESPFFESSGFGFAIRGASDIDTNGYPDVLVGAFRASKLAVYRARPVVTAKAQLVMPDALNPEVKTCTVSGTKVNCFTIKLCVGVSGKSIPQTIGLDAELQLDRMKQKFGRRVFLQQSGLPSKRFPLQVSGKLPQTCEVISAYLRDEADFKDKLSPIVVSLNFSLTAPSTSGELQPVLYGQTVIQEQTYIILDCGGDNICIPNLHLTAHTKGGSLLIGAENVVLIQAVAANAGEGAYEAELVVKLPHGAYFQRANSSAQNLVCSSRKENEAHLVACEVGNPMKANTEITVDVELGVSQLEEANNTIEFTLQLKSKNSKNPNSNVEQVQVPVKADAKMTLLGNSVPAITVLSAVLGDFNNESKKVDDYGPKVEHIYQLQNDGPSSVSGAELLVDFPSHFREGFLLYLTRVSTEGNITCTPSNETNPLKLELQEPTTAPSHNTSARSRVFREKRDVNSEVDPATLQGHTVVNCSSQMCAVIHCQVGSLEKEQRVTVTIHAVLWLQSFQERPMEPFLIQSQAQFNALGMPYHVQPESLPRGSSLAKTLVEWVNPDAEKQIPVWWIVVAVLAGLLLFAVLIIIFWKLGFFKRTRPPKDDMEQLTSEHETQSAEQE
ncbi:integrin alpha-IIb [Tiliqua scincoides]|uniref:integrin alpha-IIb n=1 Tax=Tiliqua scincoides TaxID=71010 RepID=UPI003461CF2C